MHAVILSGTFNFIGVMTGGIGVAMGILEILNMNILFEQQTMHSIAMVLALLLTAIIWNLGTWYYGIPCSSSHTLIGSIVGVGLMYCLLQPGDLDFSAIKWKKVTDIGLSLLISPVMGFALTVLVMFVIKKVIKQKKVFQEPEAAEPPPIGIRATLIGTCTAVSYAHGSNDGQKGLGLIMMLLIAIAPNYFTLNPNLSLSELNSKLITIDQIVTGLDKQQLNHDTSSIQKIHTNIVEIQEKIIAVNSFPQDSKIKYTIRKDIVTIKKEIKHLEEVDTPLTRLEIAKNENLQQNIKSISEYVEYAPNWALLLISVALGIGTMVGWKRIVVTIGEKIGKQHLSYAQGASAELVAATTILIASATKLPVSTTQVLSSGIAGAMVAQRGIKNLQAKTIKSMALAWVLTLPVTIIMSGFLFWLLRIIL